MVTWPPNPKRCTSSLSYPDPSGDPSLRPSLTNGKDIIPGAKLAIQEINNRNDILTNYKPELIEADDGCNINGKSIISLINNLYYEGKHIVGIIGPQCSDSTKAMASLTGKSEIALINVHLGSAPELGKRVLYPYSFGINPPSSIEMYRRGSGFVHAQQLDSRSSGAVQPGYAGWITIRV